MPIYNLQAIADKTNYFMSGENGATQEEAKQRALEEFGFEQDAFSPEINAELDKLINNQNMTEMSEELGNDKEKLIDRSQTMTYQTYDLNPDAIQESEQEQTPTE
jgi:hypothetical protein